MKVLSRRVTAPTAEVRLSTLPQIDLGSGLTVFEARTWSARRDGLGGLPSLPGDWGLWIAPCRSIHTVGMHFDIDLVWLDRELTVEGVIRQVPPRRLRSDRHARSVIEVRAGRGDLFAEAWATLGRSRAGRPPRRPSV